MTLKACLRAQVSICQNGPASSIISQTECTNLNDSLYATFLNCFKMTHTTLRMCHFEELEESVLQIGSLHLRSDRSGQPVLINGKLPQSPRAKINC